MKWSIFLEFFKWSILIPINESLVCIHLHTYIIYNFSPVTTKDYAYDNTAVIILNMIIRNLILFDWHPEKVVYF